MLAIVQRHDGWKHMRLYLVVLFLICGCSSYQHEESADLVKFEYGKVSSDKSTIKVFNSSVSTNQNSVPLYLYLELKDKKGKLVDCKPSKFLVKSDKGETIPFTLHRSGKGKYYISPRIISSKELVISMSGAILKVKIHSVAGEDLSSKLMLRKTMPYKAIFRLITPIPLLSIPEIITEGGNGVIEGLSKINAKTWEFALIYPEQDQLIYVSARSHGLLLSNRLRFQHVELK